MVKQPTVKRSKTKGGGRETYRLLYYMKPCKTLNGTLIARHKASGKWCRVVGWNEKTIMLGKNDKQEWVDLEGYSIDATRIYNTKHEYHENVTPTEIELYWMEDGDEDLLNK